MVQIRHVGMGVHERFELADRIIFVDFDTWTSRYPPETITVSATREPAED